MMAMPKFVLCVVLLACAGCTPNVVRLPPGKDIAQRQVATFRAEDLPAPQLLIHGGDTLRIVRDAQSPAERDEATLYRVRPDGAIAYPHLGTVAVAGRTPEDVAGEISTGLAAIYRQPQVTINIAEAPGNRVYVGGAVRNPGAFDLSTHASVAQAITATGGVLPTADSRRVALVREDAAGVQQIWFFNYADMLSSANNGQPVVRLQRGDLVFVPSSRIGNLVQGVDMYVSQLLLFRGVGVGVNYQINEPEYSINTNDLVQP